MWPAGLTEVSHGSGAEPGRRALASAESRSAADGTSPQTPIEATQDLHSCLDAITFHTITKYSSAYGYNLCMSSVQAIVALGNRAESQNGYVTSAQAVELGVSRSRLSKLASAGALEIVARGVYRMVGAPGVRQEGIYAEFLALNDRAKPQPGTNIPALVVAGASATLMHGIGGYWAESVQLISQSVFLTTRAGVDVEQLELLPRDVALVEGAPVLVGAATIADLVRRGGDWSIIADALMDALQFGLVDLTELAPTLERLAMVSDGIVAATTLLRSMKAPTDQVRFYERQLAGTRGAAA